MNCIPVTTSKIECLVNGKYQRFIVFADEIVIGEDDGFLSRRKINPRSTEAFPAITAATVPVSENT